MMLSRPSTNRSVFRSLIHMMDDRKEKEPPWKVILDKKCWFSCKKVQLRQKHVEVVAETHVRNPKLASLGQKRAR